MGMLGRCKKSMPANGENVLKVNHIRQKKKSNKHWRAGGGGSPDRINENRGDLPRALEFENPFPCALFPCV